VITLFSIPKPFQGHIGMIQANALKSWKAIPEISEIILFGSDEGVAAAAQAHQVGHDPGIQRNEFGTPLIHDVFARAQQQAKNPLLCYINADILLTSSFGKVVREIVWKEYLLVGRRRDLDVQKEILFWDAAAEKLLLDECGRHGKLHSATGIDYFVFSKNLFLTIPPFAVGRTSWDNWLIYRARSLKKPVIDATNGICAVHQNHGYEASVVSKHKWTGPEVRRNLELAGDLDYCFTIDDADWFWRDGDLRRRTGIKVCVRHISRWPALHKTDALWGGIARLVLAVKKVLRRFFRALRRSPN